MDDLTPTRFNSFPLLWLAACFGAGIVTAGCIQFDIALAIGASLAAGVLAIVFRGKAAATFFIFLAFAAAGLAAFRAEQLSVRPDRVKFLYDGGMIASGEPVEIEGVLSGRPEPSFEGEFLTLTAERIRHKTIDREVTGRVRLFLPSATSEGIERPDLRHGSRIIVACSLKREDEFLNPGVLRRPDLLDQIGIDATGSVKSALLIEHLADESVFYPIAGIYDQRSRMLADLTSKLSPTAAGIVTASMLGDKHFLDRPTAEIFREGGTFHVLVISGLHITFIGGILLLIVRSFTSKLWLQFLLTTTLVWAYGIAVGAEIPVVRAALMFTVLLYSYVLYRPGAMLNSLGLCAMILLAWRPSDVFNASFHLTFVSVAAIIGVAYPLIDGLRRIGSWIPNAHEPFPPAPPRWLRSFCEMLYWREETWSFESQRQIWSARIFKDPLFSGRVRGPLQKVLRVAFESVVVSVAVQVCLLPLLVIYFHRIPLASVVLNLWVGFFIAAENIVAVTAAFASRISDVFAAPLFMLSEVLNWLLLALPRLLTGNWWSAIRPPAYSGSGRFVYVLYFTVLAVIGFGLYRWDPMRPWRLARRVYASAVAFSLLFLTIVLHPFSSPRPDGRLTVNFLDVGQGDAALITFPDGRTMLVDGGGRISFRRPNEDEETPFEPDVQRLGESVVSEYLWHRGFSRIDHLLATHADTDHIQGLADVASNFRIESAILGRMPLADPDLEELITAIQKQGSRILIVESGEELHFGDVTVQVIYPMAEGIDTLSDNDASLVVRVVYRDRSFLLTGDIEMAAEREILGFGLPINADVIKVPHHGSRTSSTAAFVEAVSPRIAVIPVGRRSPFGHPHPEVVDRWRRIGADVLTTGEKGTITISTDGYDLKVSTFLP